MMVATPVMVPYPLLRARHWRNAGSATKSILILRYRKVMERPIHISHTLKALHVYFAIKPMKNLSIIATIINLKIEFTNKL